MDNPAVSDDIEDYVRLCFFVEMAKAISRSQTIEQTLDKVMEQIGSIFTPEHWSLLLKDPDTGDLKFAVVEGENADKLNEYILPMGEGIAGWIVAHRRSVIIEDVSKDTRFSDRMDAVTEFTTNSIIGVPLISGDKVFGVIELINKINGKPFTPYELKILSTIADFAAIAIEKAYFSNTLKKLARNDPMTGLYNRGSFEYFLNTELEAHKRYKRDLSLLMIDVDDFKHINDSYGHPIGDEVLKTLADIIRESVRTVDKACRYGGDEFIVVLPDAKKADSDVVRQRIKTKISEENTRNRIPKFSVSIGIHELSDDDNTPILSLLDDDLYSEKEKKYQGDIHCLSTNLSNMLDEERSKK
ncbi:MAG: sensor domain-containing diguanylate cyclase [Psychrosphaera sp.]|nr:sensor domain-containing diguanylate cyclase [Psychrosphaera sp.]